MLSAGAPAALSRSKSQAAALAGSSWTLRRAPASRSSQADLGAEVLGQAGRDLAPIEEQLDGAVPVGEGEGERERRVADVASAHVQEPRDRVGGGEHDGVHPGLLEGPRDLAPLVAGVAAGVGEVVGHHGSQRRARTVEPHRVDQVRRAGDQLGPGPRAGRPQPLHALGGVEPRVVAEAVPRPEPPGQPVRRRALRDVVVLEQLGRRLVAHLERVAAVHPDRGPLGEDDRQPGRSAEAGQPAEPLGVRRDVLALVLVRPRDQEAGEAVALQLGPQGAEARGDLVSGHGLVSSSGARGAPRV
jgi:hypothetical protein